MLLHPAHGPSLDAVLADLLAVVPDGSRRLPQMLQGEGGAKDLRVVRVDEPGQGRKQEVLKAKEKVMASVCGLCKEEMIDKIRPLAPSQIINYISAHDDRTLWDKLDIL